MAGCFRLSRQAIEPLKQSGNTVVVDLRVRCPTDCATRPGYREVKQDKKVSHLRDLGFLAKGQGHNQGSKFSVRSLRELLVKPKESIA